MQHKDFPEEFDTPFNEMVAYLLRQRLSEEDYSFMRVIAHRNKHSELTYHEKGRFYGLLDYFNYLDGEPPQVSMEELLESIKRMIEGDCAGEGDLQ
jgi:hypothetical protein